MFDSIWNWMASNLEISVVVIGFIATLLIFIVNYFSKKAGIDPSIGETIIKEAQDTVVTKLEQTHNQYYSGRKQPNEHTDGFRVIGAVKKPEEPKEVIVENKETNSETKEDNQDEEDSHRDNTIINSGLI